MNTLKTEASVAQGVPDLRNMASAEGLNRNIDNCLANANPIVGRLCIVSTISARSRARIPLSARNAPEGEAKNSIHFLCADSLSEITMDIENNGPLFLR